ncbi:uncharacterized protein LOC116843213 [Odontomachus brunneus]|uniref:uncharacterized protein LOC116843213 n=1 Tax=Odontomachus brunneus TaxID=486640 RepID=UPI0013F1B25A|nr:uncharacterized protein LOC116843213 [Odontomachus brunneus]
MYIFTKKFMFFMNFSVQMYGFMLIYVLFLYTPDILDVISPMNESRLRNHYFKIDYLVSEEQYISLIRIHICAVMFIIVMVFNACLTLFIAVAQHVCGMCELLWYRAERLFYVVESTAERDLSRRTKLIYRNTAVFIRIHLNVIQFIGTIEYLHTLPFLMDLLGIMVVMSITLTQVVFGNIEKAIRSILFANLQVIYISLYSYLSQQIMDNSSRIFDELYNSAWYDVIAAQQKPLLLIMKQRFQPLVLTACKFYVMSLPNLGKLFQTTVSYGMFIRTF